MRRELQVRHHCWTVLRSSPPYAPYLYVTSMVAQWPEIQKWFEAEGRLKVVRKGDTLTYKPSGATLQLIAISQPSLRERLSGTSVYGIFYELHQEFEKMMSSKLWIELALHVHSDYHHNIVGLRLEDFNDEAIVSHSSY